jgi:sortase B
LPTEPVTPTEPQPTEPLPTEPQPTEPKPTEPKPTEPKPTEPKPTEPLPTKPPHVNTTILSEMKPIYDKNKDTVGWIYIPGTNIDYPVMQTKQDPDYYIDKNFYKKDDDHGTIYANAISDVFTPSDVITLYGHHMADGTMFKDIYYYTTESYFNSHPYVYFDSLYTRRTYQVVLLFRTNGEPHSYYPFFPFHTYSNFRNETEFNYFMSSIRKLKLHESNVEVNYGDKLLCLVTCDYMPYPNGRLVLVCKQIQ